MRLFNKRRLVPQGASASTLLLLAVAAYGLQANKAQGAQIGPAGMGYDTQLGFDLAVGDFNNDGDDDLAVGAPFQDVGAVSKAGAIYVLVGDHLGEGGAFGWPHPGYSVWDQDIVGVGGEAREDGNFGTILATGDFNNDGFDDLVAGAFTNTINGKQYAGGVNIFYGSAGGLTRSGNQWLHQDTPGIPGDSEDNDLFGSTLATGDFDHDGFDDLAVGTPSKTVDGFQSAGTVHVIYGSDLGLDPLRTQEWNQNSPDIADSCEAGDAFGGALAAGDLDGDGFDDLIVGAAGEDVGDVQNAGSINVIYGSGDGLLSNGNQIWHQDSPNIAGMSEPSDYFGSGLTVGDFDRDGKDDVAVSVYVETVGDIDEAGAVNVIYGTSNGLSSTRNQIWHQDSPGIADQAESGDGFGIKIISGDFNSDGYDDLAVSAPDEDLGGVRDAGAVNVIFGTANGLSSVGNEFIHEGIGALDLDHGSLWGIGGRGERLGFSMAVGDFNENGFLDGYKNHLVITVPFSIVNLQTDLPNRRTGLVHVLSPGLEAYQHWNSFFTLRAGGGQEFFCDGACESAIEFTANTQSGAFNTTGEIWFAVSSNILGWQASEVAGRTIEVNGVEVSAGQMPLPAPVDGVYYFHFSAGTHPWASWSFW